MKIVIVGGVAGGASAAARLRRLDEQAEIVMLERTGYISYANCGLPYYIGGEITEKRSLTLQTPKSFRDRFNVDVRVHSEVTAIDRARRCVTVRSLEDGREYEECYDKLVLAPGAHATQPDIPGAASDRVFTLRTVEDTFRIDEFISAVAPECAVIAGGGYIGLEMAENLTRRGVSVTILQRPAQVMKTLDYDMSCGVRAYLKKQGVTVRIKTEMARIEETDGALSVVTTDGDRLPADMVLLAIGVTPETKLARAAGLALGEKGAIVTDDRMRTSDPDIYAVGDAVQIRHFVSGRPVVLPLAGPANRQGRLAADNICGLDHAYKGATGSSVFKLFDMTVASTGLTERAAADAGIPCDRVVLLSPSHANYYPGAGSMTVKVLYNPESGRLLGGQITGFGGVDKRIDVLATAIRAGMTARELAETDLAYAPPYSSAKDPVNMACCVIENVMTGKVRQFHWSDVDGLRQRTDIQLVDVRTDRETAAGMLPGAVHIPVDALRGRVGELDKQKTLYVYCQSGLRSYIACRMLSQLGYDCVNLSGGYGFLSVVMHDAEPDEKGFYPCGIR